MSAPLARVSSYSVGENLEFQMERATIFGLHHKMASLRLVHTNAKHGRKKIIGLKKQQSGTKVNGKGGFSSS